MEPHVEIVQFSPSLLQGTVRALLNVRSSDDTYPPQQDALFTEEAFSEWLLSVPEIYRWVALVDGEVAGHILLTTAPQYLTSFLESQNYEAEDGRTIVEIAKFFVDPRYQGHGLGDLLFRTACDYAVERGLQPALSVVSTSHKAVRFYQHHGMHPVGSFNGIHGVNHVFALEPSLVLERPGHQ